jgi:hypothetical protein
MLDKISISLTAKLSGCVLGAMLLVASVAHAGGFSGFTGSGGDKKKEAVKTGLPANSPFSNLKTSSPLQLSLINHEPGFKFSGDFVTQQEQDRNILTMHSLMTYQKGNSIYIFPYVQRSFLSKFKTPERGLR